MDAFKSLTKGARFDKKKAKTAMDLFAGKGSAQQGDAKQNPFADLFAKPAAKDIAAAPAAEEAQPKQSKKSKSAAPAPAPGAPASSSSIVLDNTEEINAFRNRLQIKVKGEDILPPEPSFQTMELAKDMRAILLRNIELSHWKEPTPIQMQAIPLQLRNRDVLAAAPTGSGKTAAYTIPLLSKLSSVTTGTGTGIKALILAPTKELADQIDREVCRLKEGKGIRVCNLKKTTTQQASKEGKNMFNKFDVLISTPLRLVSVLREDAIDLSSVHTIILDEADKLLELDTIQIRRNAAEDNRRRKRPATEEEEDEEEGGRNRSSFLAQVDEILAVIPTTQHVQRVLFSATLGPFVLELASSFLRNAVHVTIGTENAGATNIDQKLMFVGREDGKLLAMRQLIQAGLKPPVLVFVQSVPRAKELYKELIYDGINVDVMHAQRTAAQRDDVIRRFRVGEIWVLICTDLMARGIDFTTVQMVINYDLPLSAVSYIHRIGRTGRAGRTGSAVTFFTEQDIPRLRPFANVVKLSGGTVPEWMLTIKSMSTRNKRQLRQSAPKRRKIATDVNVQGDV